MRAPNDVGVLAEMIDPDTNGFLGNLPQAWSQLALVNAAITLTTGEADHDTGPPPAQLS